MGEPKKLTDAIVNLDIENIPFLVKGALDAQVEPLEILNALRRGMEIVGEKFEGGEYFFADLIMAGETMKEAMRVLEPCLTLTEVRSKGRVVLGTIHGDLHDIGKDLVKILLISAGFEVYDLGIDVSPKSFVEKAKETEADVIGVSALLSTTLPTTQEVVEELKRAGLRERVKVIIGGAAVRGYHAEKYGVDAAVNDAVKGIQVMKSWREKKK